jgi:membrane protein implicated in regulation of membrane protease activity
MTRENTMTDDSTSADTLGSGMHRSMLICCGGMLIIYGAFAISSVAAAIGLSTGQTYIAIAGFIIAAGALLYGLYRRQTSDEDNSSRPTEEVRNELP